MSKINELIDICINHKVYIQTHNYPDQDAIASAYGLQVLLKHYNIDSVICYVGITDRLSIRKIFEYFDIQIFSYDDIKSSMNADDYIICVDSQKNGGNIDDLTGQEIAVIDHHPKVNDILYKYKDIRITGACSTIITEYFRECNIPISVELATLLLYGIKMDTLQLTRGVTELDLQMFYYLFLHSSHELISKLEKNTMELKDLKAYSDAIKNITVVNNIGFAYIDFECNDALIAMISDFLLSIYEIDFSVIYSYKDSGIKFSVRSEIISIDAGQIVINALKDIGNGGGHSFMAGGFIPADKIPALGSDANEEIRSRFINEISKNNSSSLYYMQ